MKTSEKLEANWKAGLYTMVKDLDEDTYALFTTKDESGNVRNSYWKRTEEEALFSGVEALAYILGSLGAKNLQIIRTIHPSELMGPGYEVGQKVRIKPNAKEECLKNGLQWTLADEKEELIKKGYGFIKERQGQDWLLEGGYEGLMFSVTAFEPYFEDEEVTEIDGVKYSKADIEALVKSAKDLKPLG